MVYFFRIQYFNSARKLCWSDLSNTVYIFIFFKQFLTKSKSGQNLAGQIFNFEDNEGIDNFKIWPAKFSIIVQVSVFENKLRLTDWQTQGWNWSTLELLFLQKRKCLCFKFFNPELSNAEEFYLNKGDEYYEGMEKPGDQEGKSVLIGWCLSQTKHQVSALSLFLSQQNTFFREGRRKICQSK